MIEMLKMVHIGINSHSHIANENNTKELAAPIAYIENRGTDDAKQLWDYLNQCNHSVSKIQSLLAKGQVYDLKAYNVCRESCTNLVWQHNRTQGVASIIGNRYLNWENPKVKTALKNVLAIKPSEIENSLREQNSIFLGFVKDNYSAIY
jgi:BarA-like signal transduction histidine kinase